MNSQFEIHKNDWGIEIQTVFERLKKVLKSIYNSIRFLKRVLVNLDRTRFIQERKNIRRT